MTTPLPVINEAYRRFTSQSITNTPPMLPRARDAAIEQARDVQWYAYYGAAHTNVGSSTGASIDLVAVYGADHPQQRVVLMSCKEIGNETNQGVRDVALAKIRRFTSLIGESLVHSTARNDATSLATETFGTRSVNSGTSERPLEEACPWVKALYERVRLGETRKAMRLVYAAVEGYFEQRDFRTLDEVLAGIELEKLDLYSMTALVRISARARMALTGWSPLVTKVKRELARRGAGESLLVGIPG